MVEVLHYGGIVREVLLVVFHDDTRRLENVPGVVNPSAQVRLLSAASAGRRLFVVVDGLVLVKVALAAEPLGVVSILRVAQVDLDDDGGDLGVRHKGTNLDDIDDLLCDGLETRRLFGGVALELVAGLNV